MSAPSKIIELVERFDRNIDSYKAGNYNETQVRREFIDPFFKELGWDIDNRKGYAEAYKEVIHEDIVKIGGATKAPDYSFRIGGVRKFFVEAKKPSINIREDIGPSFQLRRYAWSAKLPLSILTDFEEFAVYDSRVKPCQSDKASKARTMYLRYEDYIDKWDEIYSVFSMDAILKGSFDKYTVSNKLKKGTAEVDTAFLQEIEVWRELLARNFALRNPDLTCKELNFSVQRTIDRIIFLRICEDRGIEVYGNLMALLNGNHAYERLRKLFYDADARYNSGLFHFHNEKGRNEPPDELTNHLSLDDSVLKKIIRSLYYPESPYEFSVISTEILGQVYEQFLGKVIRLTSKHQAKVEEKPEVKKAGGVYYTPSYIVEYIVNNTVGKMVEGKTPKEAAEIKIIDPACGSGSFLIGAYQFLLDWHLKWYEENLAPLFIDGKLPSVKEYKKFLPSTKTIKSGKTKKKNENIPIYQIRKNEWRLKSGERKRILLDNIHGVDIDPQAVEVTKLSLLLKVLEEIESEQLTFFKERYLPDLSDNIKCGNSLIGTDIYDNRQLNMLEETEQDRINPFDWESEFKNVFERKNPGFDVVIGNPPYVRQEIQKKYKSYLKDHFEVYHGSTDLYSYFFEKGINILKKGGVFSFIVANKWFRANYAVPLRSWLLNQNIEEIVDFGDLPVFNKVTTYPCIIRISKSNPLNFIICAKIESLAFDDLDNYLKNRRYEIDQTKLHSEIWMLVEDTVRILIEKLQMGGIALNDYINGESYSGIKTGLNDAFEIDQAFKNQLEMTEIESMDLIKPFLEGKDIKRYNTLNNRKFIIFIPKGWTNKQIEEGKDPWSWFRRKYTLLSSHLERFVEKAKNRGDKGDYWWELRACDYYDSFYKTKIVYPNICKQPEFTMDSAMTFTNQKCFIIPRDDKYLLGILNSKLMFFLFKNILPKLRGGFLEPSYIYLKKFPIKAIDFSKEDEKIIHDKIVFLVDEMLNLHRIIDEVKIPQEKKRIQRQIDATDRQIDNLVYQLYELTDEEKAIIEKDSQNFL